MGIEHKRASCREHGRLPPTAAPGEWTLINVKFDGSPDKTYTYWAPMSGVPLEPGDKVRVWVRENHAPTVTVTHGGNGVVCGSVTAHKAIASVVSRARHAPKPLPDNTPDATLAADAVIDFKTLNLSDIETRVAAAMENKQQWHDNITKDIYKQIADQFFSSASLAKAERSISMPPALGMGYGLAAHKLMQDALVARLQKQRTTLVVPPGHGKLAFAETARAAGIKVHEAAEGITGKKTDFYIVDDMATMDFETFKSLDLQQKWLDLQQKWDAITGYTNQPFKHNRIKPKENIVELKIKTVTYVNEQDVSRLTADQLFLYINAAENEIRSLSTLINQPKAVAKRITELEAGIAALLVAADGEDAAPYKPVVEKPFRERLADQVNAGAAPSDSGL